MGNSRAGGSCPAGLLAFDGRGLCNRGAGCDVTPRHIFDEAATYRPELLPCKIQAGLRM